MLHDLRYSERPNIAGTIKDNYGGTYLGHDGAFSGQASVTAYGAVGADGVPLKLRTVASYLNASSSSAIFGASSSVQPKSMRGLCLVRAY